MGVRDRANELAAELKRTPDFIELRQAKLAIDNNPSLKRELEDFNKKQNILYSGHMTSSETSSSIERLSRKYAELSKIPEIERYLRAVKSFNTLLADLLKEINASIETGLRQ